MSKQKEQHLQRLAGRKSTTFGATVCGSVWFSVDEVQSHGGRGAGVARNEAKGLHLKGVKAEVLHLFMCMDPRAVW